MKMHRPPHPGEVLKKLYMKPLGLSIARTSRALGVAPGTLSLVIRGQSRITPMMAVRLARAFRNTPEGWMGLQQQYDLDRAERKLRHARITELKAS
jgi:antitoxin HigA-1